MLEIGLTYRFVGLLLAGMFRRSTRIGAHLHMHGIDDVEEILHYCNALQGRAVLGRAAV